MRQQTALFSYRLASAWFAGLLPAGVKVHETLKAKRKTLSDKLKRCVEISYIRD